MVFNSFDFLEFFFFVYVGYWLLRGSKAFQNCFLLIFSLFFYGYWDLRFLGLLLITVLTDFIGGIMIDRTQKIFRTLWLSATLSINVIILFTFKYFNFFVQQIASFGQLFHFKMDWPTMSVMLPLGISFYTFQSMSYTIDVYRGVIKPTTNLVDYALSVCFFPHLVAGPIQRSSSLLTQIQSERTFDWTQINVGVYLILWGFFKKLVIADNLAPIANQVFDHHTGLRGLNLLVGVVAFTFQIYGDFSGYSDIARGISKLMGFELTLNFNLPYFSKSPSEFWSRWHISLTTWFRDYVYIPLAWAGTSFGAIRPQLCLFVVFVLCGLWHGAGWNFVLFGTYYGVLSLSYPLLASLFERFRVGALVQTLLMGVFVMIGFVVFRSATPLQAFQIARDVLSFAPASSSTWASVALIVATVAPLMACEAVQYVKGNQLVFANLRPWKQSFFYGCLLTVIAIFGAQDSLQFIYFQF